MDTCGTGGGRGRHAQHLDRRGVPRRRRGGPGSQARQPELHLTLRLGGRARGARDRHRAAALARRGGARAGAGLVFLFAPAYHPAMRHVGPVRKELGVATIMNLLGPLANPAGVRARSSACGAPRERRSWPRRCARLGAAHALVLHAAVGMDEVSPSGATRVWEVRDGEVREWTHRARRSTGSSATSWTRSRAATPADNAARLERLLGGRARGGALRRAAERGGRACTWRERVDVR